MWKRIIIYIIILIILLGLYLFFTPQSLKSCPEKSSSEKNQEEIQNDLLKFKGPSGPPLIKGPNGSPPQQ